MRRYVAAAVLVLFASAAPLAAACHGSFLPAPAKGEVINQDGGDDFGLRLYVAAEGNKMFLTETKPASSPASTSAVGADAALTAAAQTLVNQDGRRVVNIELKDGLSADYWLNLSKINYQAPMVGVLWWTSTLGTGGVQDTPRFRVELFHGERRVGGDDCYIGAGASSFTASNLKMRAEGYKLEKGAKLTLRVTLFGALGEFRIGTGGTTQSFLELRVTPFDLLDRATYLENRKIVFGDAPVPTQEPGSDGFAGAALTLLGLPLLAPPRRRVAILVTLTFVAGALAGCVGADGKTGPAKDASQGPQATVETAVREQETLRKANVGAIDGRVRNEQLIPLSKAHVILLGTSLFTETDAKGSFRFPNVSAGTYTLRVDRTNYQPLERPITIEVGKLLTLNITLLPAQDLGAFKREHIHDDWNGATTLPQWTSSFVPGSFWLLGQGNDRYPFTLLKDQNAYMCTIWPDCLNPILIDQAKNVRPGTRELEITLKWDPGVLGTKEIMLRVYHPKLTLNDNTYVARGPNEPFRINLFPDLADPAHQTFTDWFFYAIIPNAYSGLYSWTPTSAGTSKVQFEAIAHKGRVLPEPPHKAFWGNATELPLFKDASLTGGANDYPALAYAWPGPGLSNKAFVPPGTLEIRGTMGWTHPHGQEQPGTSWKLAYRTAKSKSTCTDSTPVNPKVAEITKTYATKIDFTIKPLADEYDSFYAGCSLWRYYPDDGAERPVASQPYSVNTGVRTEFKLTATAYRDPSYVE